MRHLSLLLILVLLAGCGSKGPLYLPEEPPAEDSPAAQNATGQDTPTDSEEEKKKR